MSASLPAAAPSATKAPRRLHHRIARDALRLCGASGGIVVLSEGVAADPNAPTSARRCATAWGVLCDRAEERHRVFWEASA